MADHGSSERIAPEVASVALTRAEFDAFDEVRIEECRGHKKQAGDSRIERTVDLSGPDFAD